MIKLQLQIINQRVRGPRADRQQHRRSDGWTDGRMDGWTDARMDGGLCGTQLADTDFIYAALRIICT